MGQEWRRGRRATWERRWRGSAGAGPQHGGQCGGGTGPCSTTVVSAGDGAATYGGDQLACTLQWWRPPLLRPAQLQGCQPHRLLAQHARWRLRCGTEKCSGRKAGDKPAAPVRDCAKSPRHHVRTRDPRWPSPRVAGAAVSCRRQQLLWRRQWLSAHASAFGELDCAGSLPLPPPPPSGALPPLLALSPAGRGRCRGCACAATRAAASLRRHARGCYCSSCAAGAGRCGTAGRTASGRTFGRGTRRSASLWWRKMGNEGSHPMVAWLAAALAYLCVCPVCFGCTRWPWRAESLGQGQL